MGISNFCLLFGGTKRLGLVGFLAHICSMVGSGVLLGSVVEVEVLATGSLLAEFLVVSEWLLFFAGEAEGAESSFLVNKRPKMSIGVSLELAIGRLF